VEAAEQYPVRAAEEADLPMLPLIEGRADTRFTDLGMGPFAPACTEASLRAAGRLLVAGRPAVGFAWLEHPDGRWHLEQLSVDPEVGRRGIGTALLRDLPADLTLTTYADVPWNAPFYARHGFSEITALTPGLADRRRREVADGLDRHGRRIVMARRSAPLPAYAAVVLAGGAATRMGGVAKPGLLVGGRSMLSRVVDAVADAVPIVVVGPRVDDVAEGTRWIAEDPPGAGPARALDAGLAALSSTVETVAVLAADLPFLDSRVISGLRGAIADGGDVAVMVDDTGRDQFLLAVWRTTALKTQLSTVDGGRVSALFTGLDVRRLHTVGLPRGIEPWRDIDDSEALLTARTRD
jgi:molybdopterin-guanine dinucleotide biosynthesis protein A